MTATGAAAGCGADRRGLTASGHPTAPGRPTLRGRPGLAILALTACVLGVGCGREGRPDGASDDVPGEGTAGDSAASAPTRPALPADPSAARDQWLESTFLPSGASIADVIGRFGPPDRRQADATPNRHVPDQTDSIVTLVYDRGLTVTFYDVTGGDELIELAEVTAPGILDDSPVDVGTMWSDVLERFGEPDGRRDGMAFYVCGSCMGAEEPVFFDVVDGVVRRIRFSYYVD